MPENAKLGDIDDDQQPNNSVYQFYFAKIEKYYLNSDLEVDLNIAKDLRKQLRKEKTRLFNRIRPLKEKISLLDPNNKFNGRNKWYRHYSERDIKKYRTLLLKHWPEAINEDLEEESNPDIELAEIMERIEKLRVQVGHGKTNWAIEKQILKELEPLERRRELLEPEVKQANAKIPKATSHDEHWPYIYGYGYARSKYDLKREIRKCVKRIREEVDPNYGRNEQKQAEVERQIFKIQKQLTPLENRYDIVKQEEEKATTTILKLQIQMKEEIALNDKFCKLQEKVKELVTKKDLVSLEELSCKNNEEFMSRWTHDDTFRANYATSVQQSLANRGLSKDGRLQDLSEVI
ncbi:proton pump-interactor BIP103-like [Chenopodium quinoa]|uniref:proton pump-interactor BIP103-like n=1 Tax=Chenopodium quinoa TaxID=63459 RepID=UPI000B77E83F|nr:proton pump-interactor BIP103-like [Chenopodium quinoa]